jgi:hypothetical protein
LMDNLKNKPLLGRFRFFQGLYSKSRSFGSNTKNNRFSQLLVLFYERIHLRIALKIGLSSGISSGTARNPGFVSERSSTSPWSMNFGLPPSKN